MEKLFMHAMARVAASILGVAFDTVSHSHQPNPAANRSAAHGAKLATA